MRSMAAQNSGMSRHIRIFRSDSGTDNICYRTVKILAVITVSHLNQSL